MPETTMYENDLSMGGKNEIWLSGKAVTVQSVSITQGVD